MENTTGFQKLIVYQKAKILAVSAYQITKNFPPHELHDRTLAELEFYFELSFELGYINSTIYNELQGLRLEVAKLLRSFQKSLREKSI